MSKLDAVQLASWPALCAAYLDGKGDWGWGLGPEDWGWVNHRPVARIEGPNSNWNHRKPGSWPTDLCPEFRFDGSREHRMQCVGQTKKLQRQICFNLPECQPFSHPKARS